MLIQAVDEHAVFLRVRGACLLFTEVFHPDNVRIISRQYVHDTLHGSHVRKHIIPIAEHHPVSRGMFQSGIPCGCGAGVADCNQRGGERILLHQFRKVQCVLFAVLHEDHMDGTVIDVPLQTEHFEERPSDFPWLVIVGYDEVNHRSLHYRPPFFPTVRSLP